jgi:thiosulfate dehydrogenase [quinone] large subunit
MKTTQNYSNAQITWLVILRVFIGWHFMYEGFVKILNPKWTSLPYLLDSKGPAASFFINLTQNDSLMTLINFINEWSLLFIGLCLILGLFSKLASIGGMVLLFAYSMSHPALMEVSYMMPFEGSYLWIDKNLVEFAALGVLCAFPSSKIIGIDRILVKILPAGFLKLKLM